MYVTEREKIYRYHCAFHCTSLKYINYSMTCGVVWSRQESMQKSTFCPSSFPMHFASISALYALRSHLLLEVKGGSFSTLVACYCGG